MKLPCTPFLPMALAFILSAQAPAVAVADQPLGNLKVKSAELLLDPTDGFGEIYLTGTAEQLGNCSCYGELEFVPGEEPNVLAGQGVVVFTAANGDELVGVIAMEVDVVHETFTTEMHWRDSIVLSDGTKVESTGRFANRRPPGLVVIAITSILIRIFTGQF